MQQRLPLFPLPNVVLFPGMYLPLHIFEDRYKQMMQDVMSVDARFGILLCQEYNPATLEGKPFDVGTIAEVVEYEILNDGRMNVLVVGSERFRTIEYDDTSQPYLMGEVVWLEDVKEGYITKKLLNETVELFHEALRLTHKILKKDYQPLSMPEQPSEISFFIAENLRGSLILKQKLLEIDSTKGRLVYERDVLSKMVKTLAVRTQIEEAFRDVH
jgi:ATP-dependent Lon protease